MPVYEVYYGVILVTKAWTVSTFSYNVLFVSVCLLSLLDFEKKSCCTNKNKLSKPTH